MNFYFIVVFVKSEKGKMNEPLGSEELTPESACDGVLVVSWVGSGLECGLEQVVGVWGWGW